MDLLGLTLRHNSTMKLITLCALLFLSISLPSQDAGEIAKFDTWHIDLGQVTHGSKIDSAFTFTNTTDQPIQIDLVSTCECTEATWTRGPIAPGKTGSINFVFDSSKKEENDPVDVDVIFLNVNPKTDNPYAAYLQYVYTLVK